MTSIVLAGVTSGTIRFNLVLPNLLAGGLSGLLGAVLGNPLQTALEPLLRSPTFVRGGSRVYPLQILPEDGTSVTVAGLEVGLHNRAGALVVSVPRRFSEALELALAERIARKAAAGPAWVRSPAGTSWAAFAFALEPGSRVALPVGGAELAIEAT